ncbi:COQ9 family protein [Parvularcula sp. IMCC14364]|uniref:COQ9 family protein n=1 Tax=Parvularcula sp. IMCC14364 TaxID=3067902 RepID=UPI00274204FB|nr:COQ9 family protein [Parvularcula sp. IMCC14364]
MAAQKKAETPGSNDAGVADDLEDLRHAILEEIRMEAVFDGWTPQSLKRASFAAGMSQEEWSRGDLYRAFPDGIADVLTFWSEQTDLQMAEDYENADPAPQRIRDKVTWLVRRRLELLDEHREAARRAAATLALPPYANVARRLTWATSDAIWRALGDTSTDYNYYTKRTILSGVWLSTFSKWLAEEELEGDNAYAATWAFLDDRIGNVMQFEKVKSKVLKAVPDSSKLFGFLGKARYGGGSK